MSTRSRAGKQDWQARRETFARELGDQIVSSAEDRVAFATNERMRAWAARGRVPWWIRAKARLQRRRLRRRGAVR